MAVALGSDWVVIERAAACTVSAVLPVMPLAVAEMVVVPALLPVARPVLLMVAALVLVEVQATWLVMF